MIFTEAKYIKNLENEIAYVHCKIDGLVSSVPLDPANRHYQAILEWVEDGNTIEDAD